MTKNYCPACGARLQPGCMACPACGRVLEQENAVGETVKEPEHAVGAAASAAPPPDASSASSAPLTFSDRPGVPGPVEPERRDAGAAAAQQERSGAGGTIQETAEAPLPALDAEAPVKREREVSEIPCETSTEEQQPPARQAFGEQDASVPPPAHGAARPCAAPPEQPACAAAGAGHMAEGAYGAAPLHPNADPGQNAGWGMPSAGAPPQALWPAYAQQGMPGAQPNVYGQLHSYASGAPQRPFYMPPPAQNSAAYPPPRYAQPGAGYAPAPGRGAGEMPEPVSMGTYLGMALLGCIPVAGLILLLVWAFDAAPRPNRRNFARGFLVARLILSALFWLILLLFFLLTRLPHIMLY